MRYRILGRLQARAGERIVDVGGPRQRRVLAALLLNPNQVVPVPRLIEAAWDDGPPSTADRQIRNRVATLRTVLTRHGGFIDTGDGGYRLRVGPGELDLHQFDDLARRGRETGDPDLLRQALALWRGPALADVDGPTAARHAAILQERRLAALETCLELELTAGRHADVEPELRDLTAAHPLHEGFAAQLVLALHRAGRSTAALAAYDDAARRLADELGVDPGAALRRAHAEVTTGAGTATGSGPPRVRPAQLPGDVAGFTGRLDHLASLDTLLGAAAAGRPVLISAIGGTAGVGKTALAVHWAHRVRAGFGDGQLYINLQGYSRVAPVQPLDALGALLRGLGLPADQVPSTVDEAAERYRSLLAGRRVLVVLDNAADADQVRPLLPTSTTGSLALITSRDTLDGLRRGVHRVALDVLGPDDAHTLLTRIVGAARADAEPAAARELARLCGYLPLALRIAAANLGDTEPIGDYTRRLTAGSRLSHLQIDGDERAAVRGAFALSYAAMPEPARRMFRLLGVPAGPDISISAAASLAGCTRDDARARLDRLVAAHLVERSGPGRYTLHDLLRAYATELADAPEKAAERQVALRRVIDHYVFSAAAASAAVDGVEGVEGVGATGGLSPAVGATLDDPVDQAAAFAWFTAEHADLLAAIEQAARSGFDDEICRLARAFTTFLSRQGLRHDKFTVWQNALAAARRTGDRHAAALAYRNIGVSLGEMGDHEGSRRELNRALEVFAHLDDPTGHAHTHIALAWLLEQQAIPREALDHARQARPLYHRAGNRDGEARSLNAIGWFLARLDRLPEALAYCEQALEMHHESDDLAGQGAVLDSIGLIHHRLEQYATAIERYRQSVAIWHQLGDRYYEADGLCRLGDTHLSTGDVDAARAVWEQARDIFVDLDHPDAARRPRASLDALDRPTRS